MHFSTPYPTMRSMSRDSYKSYSLLSTRYTGWQIVKPILPSTFLSLEKSKTKFPIRPVRVCLKVASKRL